jgi:hypothetical protein
MQLAVSNAASQSNASRSFANPASVIRNPAVADLQIQAGAAASKPQSEGTLLRNPYPNAQAKRGAGP